MKRAIMVLLLVLLANGAFAGDFIHLPNGDYVRPGEITQVNIVEGHRYGPDGTEWPSYWHVVVVTRDGVHHDEFYDKWAGARLIQRKFMCKLKEEGYSFD